MTDPNIKGGYAVAPVAIDSDARIKLAAAVAPYRLGPATTLEPLIKGAYAVAAIRSPPSEFVNIKLGAIVCISKEYKLPIILTPISLGEFMQTMPFMAQQ